eukprot:Amastigsp_a510790_17.p2 type:complete len:144 gc:universal Amastigsp_a510790_17:700-1131(+)
MRQNLYTLCRGRRVAATSYPKHICRDAERPQKRRRRAPNAVDALQRAPETRTRLEQICREEKPLPQICQREKDQHPVRSRTRAHHLGENKNRHKRRNRRDNTRRAAHRPNIVESHHGNDRDACFLVATRLARPKSRVRSLENF